MPDSKLNKTFNSSSFNSQSQGSSIRRIIFVLGSNIGDRKLFLEKAIIDISTNLLLTNIKKSDILQNKALLLSNSPKEWDIDFFNIALSADIDLSKFTPLDILKIIKDIEKKLGRINRGKWSPREIDIDIMAIEDLNFNYPDILQIPHKELFNRDFFMDLFYQIEPQILQNLNSISKKVSNA